jgi:hypothetical protein
LVAGPGTRVHKERSKRCRIEIADRAREKCDGSESKANRQAFGRGEGQVGVRGVTARDCAQGKRRIVLLLRGTYESKTGEWFARASRFIEGQE